jgi:hypothetical protein
VWICQPTRPTLDRARCQSSHISSVFSLPPLHDFDDTWTFPTLITSTADRAQQHAPQYLLVFMILLISTADPDNAHTSTNDQKVGHHSTHPLPYTPSTRVCLWLASTLDSRKHFTCTALFGLEFGHWESTHGFSRHLLFRALYPTSRARGGMHSGRLLCAWRSTVRQLCYFYFFPRANMAAKVTFSLRRFPWIL